MAQVRPDRQTHKGQYTSQATCPQSHNGRKSSRLPTSSSPKPNNQSRIANPKSHFDKGESRKPDSQSRIADAKSHFSVGQSRKSPPKGRPPTCSVTSECLYLRPNPCSGCLDSLIVRHEFPVPVSGNLATSCGIICAIGQHPGHEGAGFPGIPCKFPVLHEVAAETSSQQFESTATLLFLVEGILAHS